MADRSNFDKQQRRQEERRHRASQHRSGLQRWIMIVSMVAVILLVITVLAVRWLSRTPQQPQLSATTAAPTQPTLPPLPNEPTTQIQLLFGGDLVVNDRVVEAGRQEQGYDYTHLFMDILPVLSQADMAGINFEGNVYGQSFGSDTMCAPAQLMQALARAGVDVIQLSNSYTIFNGMLGLGSTIDAIEAAGMTAVGAYSDQQKAEQEQGFTLLDIGGLRVAIVGFTKGFQIEKTDEVLSLPENSQWCANLLYLDYNSTYQWISEAAIKTTLQNIADQKPDLTIAMLHWGSNYNDIISTSQRNIEKLLLQGGVDAIIGTHSHYVQQVKFDAAAGTVVAYSLGDLFSGGETVGSHYSILLQLEATRDNTTGETKITGCTYVPIYTLTPERDEEEMRVVRIDAAMEQYENSHIHRVSATAYQNIKSALERIRSRVGF